MLNSTVKWFHSVWCGRLFHQRMHTSKSHNVLICADFAHILTHNVSWYMTFWMTILTFTWPLPFTHSCETKLWYWQTLDSWKKATLGISILQKFTHVVSNRLEQSFVYALQNLIVKVTHNWFSVLLIFKKGSNKRKIWKKTLW